MYIQVNKLSTCVSIICTNMCNEIGGQVVYVINMPWYKLCLIDVLYRMATLTIQRLPNALKVVPFLTCAVNIYSPNGGTCFALGLVKTH